MSKPRPPRTDGQLISFQPSKCVDDCIVINANPVCYESTTEMTYVKNRNFLTDVAILQWTLGDMNLVSSNPTTISFDSGFTSGSISQSITLSPNCYRAYYSFKRTSGSTWDVDLRTTPPTEIVALVNNSTEDIVSGYIDFNVTGASSKTLLLGFTGTDETDEFELHYFFICPTPYFDPVTTHGFQLPLVDCDGDNLLSQGGDLGMNAPATATHTGISTLTEDDASQSAYDDEWDNDHVGFSIGYDGALFFKYAIDSGSISWGFDLSGNSKQLTLEYYNGNAGTHPFGFQHLYDFDPLTELSGCFKSTENVGNPVLITKGQLWINAITEEDTSQSPSIYRLEYSLENMDTEMYQMKRTLTATLEDDKYYRISFDLVNTTSVTVSVVNNSGTTIFQALSNEISFNKVFNSGTLPATKTCTVIFEFFDVIDCDPDDFYETMISNLSLIKVSPYTATVEDFNTNTSLFTIDTAHISTSEIVGNSYYDNVYYTIDLSKLLVGCYQVRISGCSDDICVNEYVSQCLNICGETTDLTYLSWKNMNIKLVGNGILDYENYGIGKNYDRHIWIKTELQDLEIEDERVVYRKSNGFNTIPYVFNSGAEVLQIFPMPEYARRAIATMMMDSFYINGVEYQKIDDGAYSPSFQANPNSPMRITVRRVGDFIISKNNL